MAGPFLLALPAAAQWFLGITAAAGTAVVVADNQKRNATGTGLIDLQPMADTLEISQELDTSRIQRLTGSQKHILKAHETVNVRLDKNTGKLTLVILNFNPKTGQAFTPPAEFSFFELPDGSQVVKHIDGRILHIDAQNNQTLITPTTKLDVPGLVIGDPAATTAATTGVMAFENLDQMSAHRNGIITNIKGNQCQDPGNFRQSLDDLFMGILHFTSGTTTQGYVVDACVKFLDNILEALSQFLVSNPGELPCGLDKDDFNRTRSQYEKLSEELKSKKNSAALQNEKLFLKPSPTQSPAPKTKVSGKPGFSEWWKTDAPFGNPITGYTKQGLATRATSILGSEWAFQVITEGKSLLGSIGWGITHPGQIRKTIWPPEENKNNSQSTPPTETIKDGYYKGEDGKYYNSTTGETVDKKEATGG